MQNSSSAPPRDFALEKKQTLWLLLALFFVVGWFNVVVGEKSSFFPLYQFICGLASTILIVRWVVLDAVQREFKLSQWWFLGFVIFSLLAMPLYLWKTRGVAAWRPVLLCVVVLFAWGLAMALGQTAAEAVGFGAPTKTATK